MECKEISKCQNSFKKEIPILIGSGGLTPLFNVVFFPSYLSCPLLVLWYLFQTWYQFKWAYTSKKLLFKSGSLSFVGSAADLCKMAMVEIFTSVAMSPTLTARLVQE